jgi:hypothetical protein
LYGFNQLYGKILHQTILKQEKKVMKSRILLVVCVLIATNSAFSQRKSITNANLEKYKQERLKREADYRANYKKLGLPSPEELAQRDADEQKKIDEYTEKSRVNRQQTEYNFQLRANALRTELAATDAELNYLRALISRMPKPQTYVSLAYPIFNYVQPNGVYASNNNGYYRQSTNVRATPNVQIYQNYLSGNYANVNVGIGYKNWHGNINLNYGTPYYYGGYEQQRAGLFARWNLLDEEARRVDLRID